MPTMGTLPVAHVIPAHIGRLAAAEYRALASNLALDIVRLVSCGAADLANGWRIRLRFVDVFLRQLPFLVMLMVGGIAIELGSLGSQVAAHDDLLAEGLAPMVGKLQLVNGLALEFLPLHVLRLGSFHFRTHIRGFVPVVDVVGGFFLERAGVFDPGDGATRGRGCERVVHVTVGVGRGGCHAVTAGLQRQDLALERLFDGPFRVLGDIFREWSAESGVHRGVLLRALVFPAGAHRADALYSLLKKNNLVG